MFDRGERYWWIAVEKGLYQPGALASAELRGIWDWMAADEGARLLGWLCSWDDTAVSEHLLFWSTHTRLAGLGLLNSPACSLCCLHLQVCL